MIRTITLLALGCALAACGGRTTTLASDKGELVKKGDATPLLEKAAEAWKNRGDRAQAEAAIAAWEEAAALDPTRPEPSLELVYAYYFLANAHARWDDDADEQSIKLYEKGIKAGEDALRLTSPEFAKQIKDGVPWQKAIKSVGKPGIPALYWQATHLGKWALLDGFTTILSHKDDVAASIKHIRELDEGYFYAAPQRYFGVYRTKIPFPGGDLPASKKHFERAIELAPTYLDTKVLFAEAYAVKKQDEDLFKKLLNEVLAAPDDIEPALIPENKNAKRTAKDMLDNIEDYF